MEENPLHDFKFIRPQTHQGSQFKLYGACPEGRSVNGGLLKEAEQMIVMMVDTARKRNASATFIGFCVLCEGDTRVIITLVWWEGDTAKGIVKQRPATDLNGWTEQPFNADTIDCQATTAVFTSEARAWQNEPLAKTGDTKAIDRYMNNRFNENS